MATDQKQRPTSADVLFGGTHVRQEIEKRSDDLFDALGTSKEQHAKIRNEFVEIENATGLAPGVVARIANSFIDGEIARARADDKDAYDAEASKGLDRANEKLRHALRATYGEDAEDLLERTQRFVRAHPKLAKVLQSHGLGSRRDIVEGIAAHVQSTYWGAKPETRK